LQLRNDTFGILAPKQTRHERQIHTGALSDGHRKRFTCRIHMVDLDLAVDGALGEHIRLALQLAGVLVDDLQRTQQAVCGVLLKGALVRRAAQKSVLRGKAVIRSVQFFLRCADRLIRAAVYLEVDQTAGNIADADHPANALCRGFRHLYRLQCGRVLVIQHAVLLGVAEAADFIAVLDHCLRHYREVGVWKLYRCFRCGKVTHRFIQLGFQISVRQRDTARFHLVSVHFLIPHQRTQHHFRVIDKVLVDRYPVCGLTE